MGALASQNTSLTIVHSAAYSGADQRKHQSSASLAFVRGIHRWPVNSLHKWPVMQKMFPFDDVIMMTFVSTSINYSSWQVNDGIFFLFIMCMYETCYALKLEAIQMHYNRYRGRKSYFIFLCSSIIFDSTNIKQLRCRQLVSSITSTGQWVF